MSINNAYTRYSSQILGNRLAADPTAMSDLRLQATRDPKSAVKAVASQFEGLFMNSLMQAMRTTSLDGEQDSNGMDTYKSLYDQQLVQAMSQRGIGLGDVLTRQLTRFIDKTDKPANVEDAALKLEPPRASSRLQQALQKYGVAQPAEAVGAVVRQGAEAAARLPSSPREFAASLLPHAQAAAEKLGVAAEAIVAHAALETGWGRRTIKAADGTESHNLFGIKAGANWQGDTVKVMTTEYVNGTPQKRVETFRAYASYSEALEDYARLLGDNPRYRAALNQGDNYKGFASALQTGGYATDPRYARKLAAVASRVAQTTIQV